MNKQTPKLTKNKFIDYLRPHMPVGEVGFVGEGEELELNDTGLMLVNSGGPMLIIKV